MAKDRVRVSTSVQTEVEKFKAIKNYFGLENDSDVLKLMINTIHAELEDTKSKYIKAKLEGLKPSAITKERGINYRQIVNPKKPESSLSVKYKDV